MTPELKKDCQQDAVSDLMSARNAMMHISNHSAENDPARKESRHIAEMIESLIVLVGHIHIREGGEYEPKS